MDFGVYTFHSVFETDALLPQYKGSTFRGVFGLALKRVVCALKRQDCESCLLREKCLYALVFETGQALTAPAAANIGGPPPPYVIEPPLTRQTEYPAGSDFDFRLILFGRVIESFPYFIYAFDGMGEMGVGRKINRERGRFRLETVSASGREIYDRETGRLDMADGPGSIRLTAGPPGGEIRQLRLVLDTPLRFKTENRLAADLPFQTLVRAALRRASALSIYYGEGDPAMDYRGMIDRAAGVRTVDNRLRWLDWRRYSNRQEREMFMGGMIGEVTYEGPLDEFLPVIDFVEQVHLGKATSFGLGKVRVEAEG